MLHIHVITGTELHAPSLAVLRQLPFQMRTRVTGVHALAHATGSVNNGQSFVPQPEYRGERLFALITQTQQSLSHSLPDPLPKKKHL